MVEGFKREIADLAEILNDLGNSDTLVRVTEASLLIIESLRKGGKVLACGNGGSAAIAQHLVAELVVRFRRDRPGLSAISLCSDPSVLTASANDMGYENVFARQIEALAREEDVLVAMTTSGRSQNIVRAIAAAKETGMRIIYLCGEGASATEADIVIPVPSQNTARIQEIHTLIVHLIAGAVEDTFAG
ncbi:MAG: D-sedoheptulose-7-phosphate isomerase [candidate division WOR-3 bacterium]